jgi:hypothetical protein
MASNKFPWWEPLTEEELAEWYREDKEGYGNYIEEKSAEFHRIKDGLSPGEPHPMAFKYREEDPKYQSQMRIFENVAAQEIIDQKRKPLEPSPPPSEGLPLPDDENRLRREKLYHEINVLEERLAQEKSKRDKNPDRIDQITDQLKWARRDVKAIPESAFQTKIRRDLEQNMYDRVAILLDSKFKNDSWFDDEKVRHDSLVAIEYVNNSHSGNTVIVPKELARGTGISGRYKDPRPGNFREVDLGTAEKKAEYLRNTGRGKDRFGHRWLNERNFIPEDRGEKLSLKELEVGPEGMSGRQFECWREGKGVIPAKHLDALNKDQYETFRATGLWPEGMSPEGEKVDGKMVYHEEQPEPEVHSEEEFIDSLKPYAGGGESNES